MIVKWSLLNYFWSTCSNSQLSFYKVMPYNFLPPQASQSEENDHLLKGGVVLGYWLWRPISGSYVAREPKPRDSVRKATTMRPLLRNVLLRQPWERTPPSVGAFYVLNLLFLQTFYRNARNFHLWRKSCKLEQKPKVLGKDVCNYRAWKCFLFKVNYTKLQNYLRRSMNWKQMFAEWIMCEVGL